MTHESEDMVDLPLLWDELVLVGALRHWHDISRLRQMRHRVGKEGDGK
jgi:hypothetical protein